MAKRKKAAPQPTSRTSSDAAHDVEFFKRHRDDDPTESAPGFEFLTSCPAKVRQSMYAILTAVATAPPKRFAGGGMWEAMHGDMSGWFEVRVDGSKPRMHYRLFCRLDYEADGRDNGLLVVISGMSKQVRTTFTDGDYAKVRQLGSEYFARNPRSLLVV